MNRLKQLIVEIHRRSLWQVLLIYVGAALMAYQVVQALTEGLGLPRWFPALAVVLFIIGLPIVLATAFVHDVAPPALRPAEPTPLTEADAARIEGEAAARRDARRRRRFLTWRNAAATFVIALAAWGAVAFGWLLVGPGKPAAGGSTAERPSIAALPFVNRSGLPEDEYFTDGIHDEILSRLAKISGLSVRGRTSVMQYRNSPKNLREIGRELNARYVLEGGVQRAGETVRINVQLVDAEGDEHLWAETYDRQLTVENLLAVQSEVALRVAEALDAKLTPAEAKGMGARPTDNLEAYEYYLRGNDFLNRSFLGVLERAPLRAVAMYEVAIELDPEFAAAWAALARAHMQVNEQGFDPDSSRLDRVRAAAERALALEPDLPEAHLALGQYYMFGGDDRRAMEEFERARRINPGDVEVLVQIADVLEYQGEAGEALELRATAAELDPRSVQAAAAYADGLGRAGRHAEAEREFDRAIALAPDQIMPYVAKISYFLYTLGDVEGARRVLREGSARMGRMTFAANLLSYDYEYFRVLAEELAEPLEQLSIEFARDTISYVWYYFAKAWSYDDSGRPDLARGAYDSARVLLEDWTRRSGRTGVWMLRPLAWAYAGLGRWPEAIATAKRPFDILSPSLREVARHRYVLALARIYVLAGQRDEALDLLGPLLEQDPLWAGDLRVDPVWDPLRGDPRFQRLLRGGQ